MSNVPVHRSPGKCILETGCVSFGKNAVSGHLANVHPRSHDLRLNAVLCSRVTVVCSVPLIDSAWFSTSRMVFFCGPTLCPPAIKVDSPTVPATALAAITDPTGLSTSPVALAASKAVPPTLAPVVAVSFSPLSTAISLPSPFATEKLLVGITAVMNSPLVARLIDPFVASFLAVGLSVLPSCAAWFALTPVCNRYVRSNVVSGSSSALNASTSSDSVRFCDANTLVDCVGTFTQKSPRSTNFAESWHSGSAPHPCFITLITPSLEYCLLLTSACMKLSASLKSITPSSTHTLSCTIRAAYSFLYSAIWPLPVLSSPSSSGRAFSACLTAVSLLPGISFCGIDSKFAVPTCVFGAACSSTCIDAGDARCFMFSTASAFPTLLGLAEYAAHFPVGLLGFSSVLASYLISIKFFA